jgi:hypothetical protein
MTFTLLPTLARMRNIYEQAFGQERFSAYLQALQDQYGELILPISGYNPMAKGHVLERLLVLEKLEAEQIMQECLIDLTKKHKDIFQDKNLKVALNLSDDHLGGWTNRYTSDYDSKFKIKGLINRDFCTPIFWSSEVFSKEIIQKRTVEYVYRSLYWLSNPEPTTLNAHLDQERYVAKASDFKSEKLDFGFQQMRDFSIKHRESEKYDIIFNFFYGDSASISLGMKPYGTPDNFTGFQFADLL